MKLIESYALGYDQLLDVDFLPRALWDELVEHERQGRVIKHSEDPVRRVLRYEVWEREFGEPPALTWDSVLAAQLRASLVVENEHKKLTRVLGVDLTKRIRWE